MTGVPSSLRPYAGWARALPALLSAALALAACSSLGESGPQLVCPSVLAVKDADKLTRFAGAGRDLTDVAFEAEVAQLAGTCGRDDSVIDVDLQVRFIAARGPAEKDHRAPFGYFVAIADADQKILARESFDTAIEFPGNATRAGIIEEVEQRIPLAKGRTGGDYVIYVGFTLSREEFDYNRRHR